MMRFRFLASTLAGTLVYVLVSLCVGRDGVWAEKQLLEQKRELSAHTAAIQKVNDELSLEKLALQKDRDVIAAFAKSLGYVGRGERLVKISGLAAQERRMYDPGMVMKHHEVKYLPEEYCKVAGLVVFILVYAIIVMFDFNRGLFHFHLPQKTHDEVVSLSL
ncbi:MAG: septum formation initiator family protein [Treponema sp.]|nr:septum formation initiator family protein [Treponema sp.]